MPLPINPKPDTVLRGDELFDELEGLDVDAKGKGADAIAALIRQEREELTTQRKIASAIEKAREAAPIVVSQPLDGEDQEDGKENVTAETYQQELALKPRAYQEEMFEFAKKQNVLACFETGAGKTLVAVLLIQHMHYQEQMRLKAAEEKARLGLTEQPKRKICVFLVNLVNLVHQQSAVLEKNTKLRVQRLFGDLEIDLWSAAQWNLMVDEHDCIVSTSRIILDGLIHGFIKITDFHLVVLDEAHHAVGDDAYARIMHFYRGVPEEQRPKIFGMSASPNKGKLDLHSGSLRLEQTLDCRILTATDATAEELDTYVNRPKIFVSAHDPPRTLPISQLTDTISRLCSELHNFDEIISRTIQIHEEWGPLVADLIWAAARFSGSQKRNQQRMEDSIVDEFSQQMLPAFGQSEEEGLIDMLSEDFKTKVTKAEDGQAPQGSRKSVKTENHADPDEADQSMTAGDLSIYKVIGSLLRSGPRVPDILPTSEHNATPKTLKLLEILRSFGANEIARKAFHGIVFVERRATAVALAELVKRKDDLQWIRCEALIGHNSPRGERLGYKNQVEVLERFRKRRLTLLVATNVLEEGLDVSPCNLVIRADPIHRHISFIQSKGRARHFNSRFVMMIEKDNEKHKDLILDLTRTDVVMRGWLRKKSKEESERMVQARPNRHLQRSDHLQISATDRTDESQIDADEMFDLEPSTGARLYPTDCPALLDLYVRSLKSDQHDAERPHYELYEEPNIDGHWKLFTCKVSLPGNARVRSFITDPCSSKRQARRMAAFLACRQLRKIGELDAHLLPKQIPRKDARLDFEHDEVSGIRIATRSAIRLYMAKVCDAMKPPTDPEVMLQPSVTKYVTVVPADQISTFPGARSMAVVMHGPFAKVNSFDVLSNGVRMSFPEVSAGRPLDFPNELLQTARAYTLALISWVSRKKWKCDPDKMPYYILPMTDAAAGKGTAESLDDFDWEQAEAGATGTPQPLLDSMQWANADVELRDRTLTQSKDPRMTTTFAFKRVSPEFLVTSKAPPDTREGRVGKTFVEHHEAVLAKYGAEKIELPDPPPPMLEVTHVGRFANMLAMSPKNQARGRSGTPLLVMPHIAWLQPLRASACRAALIVPSFIARLDQTMLARECRQAIFGAKWVQDVVTNDLMMTALTTPAAGQGFNYQRLEFLGDTYVKLLATCHVFASNAVYTEGELHLGRRALISNAKLFRLAQARELWRYMQGDSFTKRSYQPPNFVEVDQLHHRRRPKLMMSAGIEARDFVMVTNHVVKDGEKVDEAVEQVFSEGDDGPYRPTMLSNKSLADVIEAIIGAAAEHDGLNGALKAAVILEVLPVPVKSMAEYGILHAEQVIDEASKEDWDSRVSSASLEKLEAHLDYKFKRPYLALMALTHSTRLASTLPSYERLEFLGDAVLDYFVVSYCYHRYPHLNEGRLTNLKGLIVANTGLGALSEFLQLPRFLAVGSEPLRAAIDQYVQSVGVLRKAEMDSAPEDRKPYWQDVTPPKACADVVESLLGALLVDADFDIGPAQEFFDERIRPFIQLFCNQEEMPAANPTSFLAMIRHRGCKGFRIEITEMATIHRAAKLEGVKLRKEYLKNGVRCRFYLHGALLAETTQGSRKTGVLEVCRKAITNLTETDWHPLYLACDCSAEDRNEENLDIVDTDYEASESDEQDGEPDV